MYGWCHLPKLDLPRLDPFNFRAFGSFAQGDGSWEGCLVHRVPKKTSIAKADLQNSTASQGNKLVVLSLNACYSFARFKNFTPSAVEPGRFRYGDE